MALSSIINDDLFYLVTIEDINFFELFRLTQTFRNKLRIVESTSTDIPSINELSNVFPGEITVNNEIESAANIAHHSIITWINLINQMNADNDIISAKTVKMIFPMISRKFTVQFPISFIDFSSVLTIEEFPEVFNENYPSTLNDLNAEYFNNLHRFIYLGIVRLTDVIKYNDKYDKLLELIKYADLNSDNELIKFNLISLSKYDDTLKSVTKCSFFNADKTLLETEMAKLSKIEAPLELEFAVKMPIEYMQILVNKFSNDELEIKYESSMKNIINNTFVKEDFNILNITTDNINFPTEEAISAYRVRLTEANQICLNTINLFINSPIDINNTYIFSMLPSMYMTSAVIKISNKYIDVYNKYINTGDPLLVQMFQDMFNVYKEISLELDNIE